MAHQPNIWHWTNRWEEKKNERTITRSIDQQKEKLAYKNNNKKKKKTKWINSNKFLLKRHAKCCVEPLLVLHLLYYTFYGHSIGVVDAIDYIRSYPRQILVQYAQIHVQCVLLVRMILILYFMQTKFFEIHTHQPTIACVAYICMSLMSVVWRWCI